MAYESTDSTAVRSTAVAASCHVVCANSRRDLKELSHKQPSIMATPLLITSAEPSTEVHLLPCIIEHSGMAQVSSYFRPQPSGTVDGLEVLEASFRGRSLQGARLPLPDGYTGLVLAQQQREPGGCCQGSPAEDEQESGTCWAAQGIFKALHYWNHDMAPAKTDALRRCLDWAQVAAQVHQPLAPADLDADQGADQKNAA